MELQYLESELKLYRERLLKHSLYANVESPRDLQIFMQHHVYAVWDFMSLLKALQQQLTCTTTPWVPVGNAKHRYLINEIVLAEETDINLFGERQSHFEMYLDAMAKAKADPRKVNQLITEIRDGATVEDAISAIELPQSVQQFLQFTFQVIQNNKPHEIAAAFTYGREELIPDMFTSIIGEIQQKFPEEDLSLFKYYFDRHIELDGDEHGPMALELITELCGNDAQKWEEVKQVSIEALNVRAKLWDGIEEEITQSLELAQ